MGMMDFLKRRMQDGGDAMTRANRAVEAKKVKAEAEAAAIRKKKSEEVEAARKDREAKRVAEAEEMRRIRELTKPSKPAKLERRDVNWGISKRVTWNPPHPFAGARQVSIMGFEGRDLPVKFDEDCLAYIKSHPTYENAVFFFRVVMAGGSVFHVRKRTAELDAVLAEYRGKEVQHVAG